MFVYILTRDPEEWECEEEVVFYAQKLSFFSLKANFRKRVYEKGENSFVVI